MNIYCVMLIVYGLKLISFSDLSAWYGTSTQKRTQTLGLRHDRDDDELGDGRGRSSDDCGCEYPIEGSE